MTNQYLTILQESMEEKSKVLDEIQLYNEKQYQMFKEEQVSLNDFDQYVEEKGNLIDQLVKLDEGFEALYEKIGEEVVAQKELYAEQIKNLQALITDVTEKSVSVQAQEARNKTLIEQYFKKQRQEIKKSKQNTKAAYGYYKSMSNINTVDPQFMDQKK